MKKILAVVLCTALLLCLVGCEPKYTAPDITFTAAAATGYEWLCTVADESVAAAEATTESTAEPGVTGGPLRYVFTFSGLAAGETQAVFTFGRSWENGRVKCTCPVTVDEELHVTLGELSDKVLELDMGSGDYQMICFDTDVVAAEQSEGLFTFTAVQPGTTRVDFFYMPEESENAETGESEDAGEEFTDRAYEITVDESGMFFWMEIEADDEGTVDMGFTDYKSAKELASEIGLFVPECKEMKSCEYTCIHELGLACVNFTWDDVPVAYAAGSTSLEGLTDGSTVEMSLAGTTVHITSGKVTDPARTDVTAVWQTGDTYSYIASEDPGFTQELMETILTAIIEAQNEVK